MKKMIPIMMLMFGSFVLGQTTIFVDVSATSGSNNGTSWANAYTSFQAALNAAASGDQIWVAKGTYKPSQDYDLGDESNARLYHFRMKNVDAIYGGFAGTESSVSARNNYGVGGENETILSGDLNDNGKDNNDCYHIFFHPDDLALTSSTVLDGFTIKGGNANGSDLHSNGGGMFNSFSSPTLSSCTFTSNSAGEGGGMSNYYSSPTLTNCTFTSNSDSWGGGMYNYESSPTLTSCTFASNMAYTGGGMYNHYNSSPTLIDCSFKNNSAINNNGGGMSNEFSSHPTLTNCIFTSNSATFNGGGMNNYESSPTLINCTFTSNSAKWGGGMEISSSSPTLNNCIVWGNTASDYGNQFDILDDGTTTLNYSCYANGNKDVFLYGGGTFTATNNNITIDPKFVEPATDDYRIAGNSPCKNTGANGYNATGTDIRGQVRNQNITIDMGAYEYTIGIDHEVSLPVELTSFSATSSNGNVSLNWQTATEVNNYGFEIERTVILSGAKNPLIRNWQNIGFVEGSGNSNSPKEYSFIDRSAASISHTNYLYRLKQIDIDGAFTYSEEIIVKTRRDESLPTEFELFQNYPNPFNPTTTIKYVIPSGARNHKDFSSSSTPRNDNALVTIKVYDILGNEVATLVNETKEPGVYEVEFDGSNLASGIYFYKLMSGNFLSTKKIIMLK
ncbi:MAG: T9SS type A sorting domain-containing protein [bacterium]